jgi:hypothetical protein
MLRLLSAPRKLIELSTVELFCSRIVARGRLPK